MKKYVSIILSIFLVMGAVVSIIGEANAEPSNEANAAEAWAGQWTCHASSTTYPNNDFIRLDTIRFMTIIQPNGSVSGTDWVTFQINSDFVGGATFSFEGTIVAEPYPTIEISTENEQGGLTYKTSSRCIGQQLNLGVFMEATCNATIVVDGANDWIEQYQCTRTVAPSQP